MRAASLDRELRHVAAIEPDDVEDVVADLAAAPRHFSVENDVVNRQRRDCLCD